MGDTKRRYGKEELQKIREILEADDLSPFFKNPMGGRYVQEFEQAFADYVGTDHAVSVSSGTVALYCAYTACGLSPGDEAITTPLTFAATASMMLERRVSPVFADIQGETFNLDPDATANAVTDRTKLIVPVHLLGGVCEMDRFMEIAQEHDLMVVEDAAQALGADLNGYRLGGIGHAGIFSFQSTKLLGIGEGGIVVTNDPKTAQKVREIRNCAHKYHKKIGAGYGWNFRLTEIQAAIGLCQLKRINEYLRAQRENAYHFLSRLPRQLTPPYVVQGYNHSFSFVGLQYGRRNPSRNALVRKVCEKGGYSDPAQPGNMVTAGYSELVCDLPAFKHCRAEVPAARTVLPRQVWTDVNRWPHGTEDMDKLLECFREMLQNA